MKDRSSARKGGVFLFQRSAFLLCVQAAVAVAQLVVAEVQHCLCLVFPLSFVANTLAECPDPEYIYLKACTDCPGGAFLKLSSLPQAAAGSTCTARW